MGEAIQQQTVRRTDPPSADVATSSVGADRNVQGEGSESMSSVDLVPIAPAFPAAFAPPLGADALADALVAGQLSPRTRRAYASDLAELLSVLEKWQVGLTGVTRDHLHAYRSWLAGEAVPGLAPRTACAPASVSRKVSVARQFFAEAEGRGLIPANPAARLRGFRVSDESKTLGLSRQQARDLLEGIDTATLLGLRDRALLSLMIRTGLRRMDALGATLGALGEQQGHRTLRVVSKGNKERLIKVPPEVARHLDAWRTAAGALREEGGRTPLFCGIVKAGRGRGCATCCTGAGSGRSRRRRSGRWWCGGRGRRGSRRTSRPTRPGIPSSRWRWTPGRRCTRSRWRPATRTRARPSATGAPSRTSTTTPWIM